MRTKLKTQQMRTQEQPAASTRQSRPATRARSVAVQVSPAGSQRNRRAMVLLFVVVLLTLLAVLGGAYLVSSRIDNSQVSPSARGGVANPYGLDAADRVDQVMSSAQTAVQRKLFLDAFAYNGIVPTNAGAYPSAARVLGDESGDGDINNAAGDGFADLLWRPTGPNQQAIMPVFSTPPTVDELGVFAPMAPFLLPATPGTRGMIDLDPTLPAGERANTVMFPYHHVDALGGTDTHLASRLPVFDNYRTTSLDEFMWPWISGPIVGVPDFNVENRFVDPFDPTHFINFDLPSVPGTFVADLQRANVVPSTYGPVGYPAPANITALAGANPEFYNDRLRLWPAFLGDFNQDTNLDDALPAADADGDGVADAGLVPLVFNEELPPPGVPGGDWRRYQDAQTGYVYLIGIRVVDNNAAINVNTALTRFGDVHLAPPTGPIDLATADYEAGFTTVPPAPGIVPNRGIYPSNIGLYELFAMDSGGSGNPRSNQFQSLLSSLLGNQGSMTVSNTSGLLESDGITPYRSDIQHATLGELLSMNRDRLLDYPPATITPPSPFRKTVNGTAVINPFRGSDEDAALLFKGSGWIIPESTPTRMESAAFDALRTAAGNFVPNPKLQFEYFPIGLDVGTGDPNENQTVLRALWAAHFKHADPDMTTLAQLEAAYATPGALGTRFGSRAWPLSPRAGIVAHNGVNSAFRPHTLLTTGDLRMPNLLPAGMPVYADDGTGAVIRPPVRASVNTVGFAELWRAYWNVMVEPDHRPYAQTPGYNPPGYSGPTFVPGQRLLPADPQFAVQNTTQRMFRNDLFQFRSGSGGGSVPNEFQVLTLRSALAAINALDIRDIEDVANPAAAVPTAADIVLRGEDLNGNNIPDTDEDANDNGILDPGEDLNTNGQLDKGEDVNGNGVLDPAYFTRAVGSEAQPFITEVVMTFLPAGGLQYLGIELYNPYPFDLNLTNWYLIGTTRLGTGAIDVANINSLTGLDFSTPINITIPANSHFVLQNAVPPAPITPPPVGKSANNLVLTPGKIQSGPQGDVNREILLVRPLMPGGPLPLNGTELLTDNLTLPARYAYVAVDSFDPTGIFPGIVTPPPGTDVNRWRYVRASASSDDPSTADPIDTISDPRGWKFVSHGAYSEAPDAGRPYTAGMVPVPLATTGRLGWGDLETEVAPSYGPIRSIPIGPVLGGPLHVDDGSGTAKPLYPYGGFARDGDALGIPFFGGYRVYRDTGNGTDQDGDGDIDPDGILSPISPTNPLGDELVELVAPTLDAFFVDSATAPATTHIGRLIPQGLGFKSIGTAASELDEGYGWAEDFFEYITTLHAPGKDLLPHADNRYRENLRYEDTNNNGTLDPGEDLNSNGVLDGADNNLVVNPGSVPVQVAASPTLFDAFPGVIDNDGDNYANGLKFDSSSGNWVPPVNPAERLAAYQEAFLPVEGKLNLNTADFGVLKLLPLAMRTDASVNPPNGVGVIDTARISGTDPGNPTSGLAGYIYLGLQAPPVGAAQSLKPYRSLFFLNGLGADVGINFQSLEPNPALTPAGRRRIAGDITGVFDPAVPPTFAGLGDNLKYLDPDSPQAAVYTPTYEDHTLQLARISNLTTLRSDSYTVYIVVQAWENFGNPPQTTSSDPPPARLVRQQRAAFLVDRSGITPFNPNAPAPFTPWTPDDINGDAWKDALKVTPIPVR